MAIIFDTTGTWAELTASGSVTIPGAPTAGNRMFLFASWKTYTITVTNPDGWTPIGTEYADGVVAAGNGTGSMKVMAWYRDWQEGDGNPTLTFSASPTIASAVIMLWQKGGGEIWTAPLTVTGAMTNWTTTQQVFSASSTVAVPDGSVVMGLVGIRDDSTLMTRVATTGIDVASGITWNGNYIEAPSNHKTTTTGFDMAADLGHRFVTTGGTVTLRMAGAISAAETGTGKWVVQGVATADPKTATPSTASLATTRYTPIVATTNNITVTLGAASLITTPFIPSTILGTVVVLGVGTLATTLYIPTVTVESAGIEVIPGTASLTATRFAPVISISNNITVTLGVASLATTKYIPTIAISDNKTVIPGVASLTTTKFSPSVVLGVVVTPSTRAITTSRYAPIITVSDNKIVIPGVGSLVIDLYYAPTVSVTDNIRVVPNTADLITSLFAPTVGIGVAVTPNVLALVLTKYRPEIWLGIRILSVDPSVSISQQFQVTKQVSKVFDITKSLTKIFTLTGRIEEN